VVALSKDADERVSQTATAWLANTGFGLDDPAAVLATIKRLDNRHVDYRIRLALLRKLEGKQIDGQVRAGLEQMYVNAWSGATLQSEEVVPQEKSQEIAAVLWAVKPDRRAAETAWGLLGHGWPMLADSVAAGFSKLGGDGLAVLAEKLPKADPARRDRGVEALAGYAAAGQGLAASEPLVAALAAAWEKNRQPGFRGKVLACLAAIDPASWQADASARGNAEKLLLAAAADPDPRLLDRVPAVATSLGVPTPKLAEPRPPANTDAVLGRLKDADPARGAKLFADARGANCAACHRAGDHGVGGIGPELSDIGLRAAPAAIVESILQPSATIIEGYRVSTLVLDDGRSLTGLVLDDTPDTLRVIDAEGRSTSVRKDAIEERAVQQVSLMPAGYDRTLTPEELADLVAFLLTQKRPAGQVAAAP
jgi:putative heme-binding domain-containing protein